MGERYVLPASMGSHECEIIEGTRGYERPTVQYEVEGQRVTTILPFSLLGSTLSPPPEEPPEGTVVLVAGGVYVRRDHPKPASVGDVLCRWWPIVNSEDLRARMWHRLCELAAPDSPVRLVPDPLAGEPVDLPCPIRSPQENGTIWVHAANGGLVNVRIVNADSGEFERIWLGLTELQLLARAVLTAATQAERNG